MAILAIEPPQGWKLFQEPKGTTMKSPLQLSEGEVEFQSGENETSEIKIVDGSGGVLPFLGIAQAMEMESSEEYMKTIEI